MIKASKLIALFQDAIREKWGYIWGTAGVQWTQAKQNQKVSYMESKYGSGWKTSGEAKSDNYYYAALSGSKWIGHTVADCSGMFAWAFKKLGGAIAHGSNSIWDRYCASKGKLKNGRKENGEELKPGTAVFVYNESRKNRSHIGLYVGNGKVVEAASTDKGVITSEVTAKKWAEWGELKDVEFAYDQEPDKDDPADEQLDGKPTIRKGDKGEYVTLAQTELIQKGYDCGKWGADGKFGAATEAAVIRFQQDRGLEADGIIGPDTWEALDCTEYKSDLYKVTIPSLPFYQAEALVVKYKGATMEKERW